MELNDCRPARDRELLEAVRTQGNAALKSVARRLLTPGFFPPGDPHDALMLGKMAFVARKGLRKSLQEFTNPNDYSTHVLIVRGDEPGGKSYTWQFLRHLASSSSVAGVQPVRLNLKATSYSPREFVRQAMVLLRLDDQALPELADNPQLARTSPLLNVFQSRIVDLQKPYWLVIDDLNEPTVAPIIRETAYAMAFIVEELKPANLWMVLLGYNPEIVDPEMRNVEQDDARFPGPDSVAGFFESVATAVKRYLSGMVLAGTRRHSGAVYCDRRRLQEVPLPMQGKDGHQAAPADCQELGRSVTSGASDRP